MCGISGYISLTDNDPVSVVNEMTSVIQHRGPDGFGHQQIENCCIGHRRLSIIDLESGKQPMSNTDQTLWITYNGELYNYKELRSELEKHHINFSTNSDTEVIIYAFQVWGKDCVKKFRGMFAFGIIDTRKKEIFIARDHFGIKPVYIYQNKQGIGFASELQQFKSIPGFEVSINTLALNNYLQLQYIPAPLTIFNNAQKLKPAHHATISFSGNISDQTPYWDIQFERKKIKTQEEWIEATGSAIKDSVKAHLVSDVPFGAFLSGGIDSTVVVKYMSELLSKPLKTFSIGFNEADFNELEYSEKAANVYGTEHHIEIVKPDALALLPDLVKHYGEPFGDSSCLPTYYVCKLAKKHVTMVLSGDGGDECFAGYSTYADWMNELPINYRKGFKKIIYPTLEKLLPARYPKKDTLDTWLRIIEYNSGSWRYNLWREELRPTNINYPYEFEKLFDLTRSFSPCNKVQYMDARSYMTYDILNKVDVTSMMHSLEVRTPLIDKTLWEYASTIPEEFLIQRQDKKWNGKILLKQLLEKEFSNEFINRKKQGFAVPLSKWFSSNGELNSFVESKILNKNALLNNYFNPSGIAELTRNDNYGSIWLLLFLEEWLQQFKNFQKNEQKHYSIN